MVKVLALGMLLVTNMAMAEFSGTWRGVGKEVNTFEPISAHCSEIAITLRQTPTVLYVDTLNVRCRGLEKRLPFQLEIRNGKLFLGQREYGYITENLLRFYEYNTHNGHEFRRTEDFILENGILKYRLDDTSDEGTYLIEGVLP